MAQREERTQRTSLFYLESFEVPRLLYAKKPRLCIFIDVKSVWNARKWGDFVRELLEGNWHKRHSESRHLMIVESINDNDDEAPETEKNVKTSNTNNLSKGNVVEALRLLCRFV